VSGKDLILPHGLNAAVITSKTTSAIYHSATPHKI